jgi:hypothetical protein
MEENIPTHFTGHFFKKVLKITRQLVERGISTTKMKMLQESTWWHLTSLMEKG